MKSNTVQIPTNVLSSVTVSACQRIARYVRQFFRAAPHALHALHSLNQLASHGLLIYSGDFFHFLVERFYRLNLGSQASAKTLLPTNPPEVSCDWLIGPPPARLVKLVLHPTNDL